MGFDVDTHKIMERFQKWSNTNAIMDADYSVVMDLLARHHSERSRLFDELLNHLKREKDCASPWQGTADKGLELNDRLNSAIAAKVPDGFRGLGMSDFYEGEKKAWQGIKSGLIASLSEIISEIARNDVELAQAFDNDLKKAREEGKVIEELVRTTFGENRESMRALTVDAAQRHGTKLVGEIPIIGKLLAAGATKVIEIANGGDAKVREYGRKRKVIKEAIIANRDKMDKLREALSEKAVEVSMRNANEISSSWRGNANNGEYGANDWESFGSQCRDIIRSKADPAMEKAKKLYQEVYPAHIEAITKTFVTLFGDPSTLENFRTQLNDDQTKLFDELAKDLDVINALKDSEIKRTGVAALVKIREDVTAALRKLKDSIAEMNELMKN